jgi:DNA polymerase I-like protein with 3'-5' exonuclease and polymerase domains
MCWILLPHATIWMPGKKYLDYTTVGFEDIAGKGANQLTFNQIDMEKAAFYAAEDADITCACMKHCGRNSLPNRHCSQSLKTSKYR